MGLNTYQEVISPKIYYVYKHIDPETREVMYIGKGSKGRAWYFGHESGRSEEHNSYLMTLTYRGYTAEAFVEIISSQLTEEEAFKLESALLEDHFNRPKYNSKKDHSCKLTQEVIDHIFKLRGIGFSYDKIAKEVGFSTMTVYRAYTGQTKNYAKS